MGRRMECGCQETGSNQWVTGTPLVSFSALWHRWGRGLSSRGAGETPGLLEGGCLPAGPLHSQTVSLLVPLLCARPMGVGDTASCCAEQTACPQAEQRWYQQLEVCQKEEG